MRKAVEVETYSDLEREGVIQRFEYTFELAWKTLPDLLKHKGYEGINGPREVILQAFQDGYIEEGQNWMEMIVSRNMTIHTYNEEVAQEILKNIKENYYYRFQAMISKLEKEI